MHSDDTGPSFPGVPLIVQESNAVICRLSSNPVIDTCFDPERRKIQQMYFSCHDQNKRDLNHR